ncbi:MAG: glycosyltransferase family 2 protein [Prevotella sp.]
MKLSVVIVSYNVRYYLEQCIASLNRAARGIETEVWVVDNHSSDDSVDLIRQRFPDVHVVAQSQNLGFARANNIAIRKATGQYVLLLNPDTIVAEDTLRAVVDFMDQHPKAGGCGVKMMHCDGSDAMESRRGLPSPLTAFYKMTGLCSRFPNHPKLGHYYMSGMPWDKPGQIEVVSGAFFMLRHEALDKIGLLDEDFFMYGEDIDLSYRLLKGGYENWYVPARILHYKGESTQKSSFRYVHVFYEAMLIFFRKHYSGLSLLVSIPIKLAILGKAFMALSSMMFHRAKRSLGFFDRPPRPYSFLFIGSESSLQDCRRIVRDNGLDAKFIVGTEQTLPDGHLSKTVEVKDNLCVVYDTDSYSFASIFRIFSTQPKSDVLMGTYSKKTTTVITIRGIYK